MVPWLTPTISLLPKFGSQMHQDQLRDACYLLANMIKAIDKICSAYDRLDNPIEWCRLLPNLLSMTRRRHYRCRLHMQKAHNECPWQSYVVAGVRGVRGQPGVTGASGERGLPGSVGDAGSTGQPGFTGEYWASNAQKIKLKTSNDLRL